jgi:hypothetical protein
MEARPYGLPSLHVTGGYGAPPLRWIVTWDGEPANQNPWFE